MPRRGGKGGRGGRRRNKQKNHGDKPGAEIDNRASAEAETPSSDGEDLESPEREDSPERLKAEEPTAEQIKAAILIQNFFREYRARKERAVQKTKASGSDTVDLGAEKPLPDTNPEGPVEGRKRSATMTAGAVAPEPKHENSPERPKAEEPTAEEIASAILIQKLFRGLKARKAYAEQKARASGSDAVDLGAEKPLPDTNPKGPTGVRERPATMAAVVPEPKPTHLQRQNHGGTKMTTKPKTIDEALAQVKIRLGQLIALVKQDSMIDKAQNADKDSEKQENANRLTLINTILARAGAQGIADNPQETKYNEIQLDGLELNEATIESLRTTLAHVTMYETAWVKRTLGSLYKDLFDHVDRTGVEDAKIKNAQGELVITTGSARIGSWFFGANLRDSTKSLEGCLVNLATSTKTLADLRAQAAFAQSYHPKKES